MAQNIFRDPKTAESYAWRINHSEETDATGKDRNVSYGGNTAGTGLIAQQGSSTPMEFHFTGAILREEQHVTFVHWYHLCEDRTILFTDMAGDEYEVQMTVYNPTRQRTIKNPQGGSKAQLWYWKYEMVLRVIRVISGPWAGSVV